MALTIYNLQTRQKELFLPINSGEVRMYVCGITAYDDAHIGHARCYIVFDTIYRHLLSKGYRVIYVRNFTDIDDKIIYRATNLGLDWDKLATSSIKSFSDDMIALGVLPPTFQPRATDHIQEIIAQIKTIIANGYAYILSNGDVFFAVNSFLGYGKLSGRTLKQMLAGVRIKVDQRKRNPMDFALWKSCKNNQPAWDSPWGLGRPGWHIECSAMSQKYLGNTFDIHGGGEDLLFPHHENEIAQAEAANGQPFVRYWIHNGLVKVNLEKMSKSLGNFFTIKDILKYNDPECLRLFFLSKHYRSPLNFTNQALKGAAIGLGRLYSTLLIADQAKNTTSTVNSVYREKIQKIYYNFEKAMDNDFNTAAAVGELFNLAKITNQLAKKSILSTSNDAGLKFCAIKLKELGGRLGILTKNPLDFLQSQLSKKKQDKLFIKQGYINSAWINEQINLRHIARKNKNFLEADLIRNKLSDLGILLEDSFQGTDWRIKNRD